MKPRPKAEDEKHHGSGKLEGKVAIITGGDSGVGVNNAAEQHRQDSIENISAEQLKRTFRTNIFSFFFMTKAALKHLKKGSAIINTTSVTASKGNPELLDYSSTKGATVAFTRSLSQGSRGKAHSGECGRSWSNLDAIDPGILSSGRGRDLWNRHTARPPGSTGRRRAKLCVPRLRRRVLHDRSGSAPERRHCCERITRQAISAVPVRTA